MNHNFYAWSLSRTSLAGSQTTRSSRASSRGQNGVSVNNPNHRPMPSSSNPTQNIFFDALVLGAPPQNSSQQNPGLAPLIIPDDGVGATEIKGISEKVQAGDVYAFPNHQNLIFKKQI